MNLGPAPALSLPGSEGGLGKGYGRGMRQTRRGLVLAAGLAVLLTAGCGSEPAREARDPVTGRMPVQPVSQAAIDDPQHTDATILTVLGLAKRESERNVGPQTGNAVSPVLWEAARDALSFAGFRVGRPDDRAAS